MTSETPGSVEGFNVLVLGAPALVKALERTALFDNVLSCDKASEFHKMVTPGSSGRLPRSGQIMQSGRYIGVVVADTLEEDHKGLSVEMILRKLSSAKKLGSADLGLCILGVRSLGHDIKHHAPSAHLINDRMKMTTSELVTVLYAMFDLERPPPDSTWWGRVIDVADRTWEPGPAREVALTTAESILQPLLDLDTSDPAASSDVDDDWGDDDWGDDADDEWAEEPKPLPAAPAEVNLDDLSPPDPEPIDAPGTVPDSDTEPEPEEPTPDPPKEDEKDSTDTVPGLKIDADGGVDPTSFTPPDLSSLSPEEDRDSHRDVPVIDVRKEAFSVPSPSTGPASVPTVAPAPVMPRPLPMTGKMTFGRIIPVTVPKGGAGKSSLSLELSVLLATRLKQVNRLVALVDADKSQGDIGMVLGVTHPTVTELYQAVGTGHMTASDVLQFMPTPPGLPDNFRVLLAPASTDESHISMDIYRQALGAIRTSFDYIFVDCPVANAWRNDEMNASIFGSLDTNEGTQDTVLVPLVPDNAMVRVAMTWMSLITSEAYRNAGNYALRPEMFKWLLNQDDSSIGMTLVEIRAYMNDFDNGFLGTIPSDPRWKQSRNNRRLISTNTSMGDIHIHLQNILWQLTRENALDFSRHSVQQDSQPPKKKKKGWFSKKR